MALNIDELMDRIVANEKAALLALASPPDAVDAVPRFFHVQSSFPYFTNRLGSLRLGDDSEDIDTITVDVMMRLVIGHLTSGVVEGENDDKLNAWLPQVLEYFHEREGLQSAAYPDDMAYLWRARIVSCTGFTVFRNSAVGTVEQVGTEFTLRCEFSHDILQAYT